jgi:ATP-binding cassette subfamily G (WHITE) protein 1
MFFSRIFEMFDKLVMLTDGQTIYRGRVDALVPFLADMGLECPSYHNPVFF